MHEPHMLFTGPILAAGDSESRLLIVLVQLAIIIAIARVFAMLFRRIGQPAVVGEICAGLILGPSILGKLEAAGWVPHISGYVFDASVAPVLGVMSQLGLILLLFLVGLEFDFRHLKSHGRAAMSISIMGIVAPLLLGMGLGHFLHGRLPEKVDELSFVLFMGVAMSITALPILGRMMVEMKISRTRVGAITITSAAVDDAVGWILLAAVSALVQSRFNILHSAGMIGMTVAFAAVMMLVVRPAMKWWIGRTLARTGGDLSLNALAIVLIVLFVCSIATSLIGIFAIFGAFILGAVLSDQQEFREAVSKALSGFVTVFFLPIFFTYTGLRTDIGSLHTLEMWLFAAGVMAAAIAGKFGGCTLAARLSGFSMRESTCIGVMMNTRALMELVVINVGYDLGVIPQSVFCMLVMMAIGTTLMTTPILQRAMWGTELEEGFVRSGFARGLRGPAAEELVAGRA